MHVSLHILGSIGHFLYTARSRSIPLVWGESSDVSIPDHLARFGMTAKKSHEVTSFSEYVNQLTSAKNIYQVNYDVICVLFKDRMFYK